MPHPLFTACSTVALWNHRMVEARHRRATSSMISRFQSSFALRSQCAVKPCRSVVRPRGAPLAFPHSDPSLGDDGEGGANSAATVALGWDVRADATAGATAGAMAGAMAGALTSWPYVGSDSRAS